MNSNHIDRIKSIAGKIGSDIANWEAKGFVSKNVINYYENKINILKQKMNYMIERLKFRRRTIWDNISEFFLCSYHFIFNIAFYHFRKIVIPSMNNSGNVSRTFNAFANAAEYFEDFINEINNKKTKPTNESFANNQRS
jgi:hypothetical protein